MMFRKHRLAAFAAIVALGLTGCAGASNDSGSGGDGGTLTLGLVTQATTFKAADIAWANESPYGQAVYDGLLRAEPDGTIVPWLATKWSYNADKTVLTMTLRDDVKFTDGSKFTAAVAAQNLLRFRDGVSPQKSYLKSIKDATATNDTTLVITLTQVDPGLLTWLTQNPGLQASPKTFDGDASKTKPVGSGPYELDQKDTVVGSTYMFTKNPHYWAPKTVQFSKIEMKVFTDPSALLNAVKGGQVNAANLIQNGDIEQAKNAGFTAHAYQLDWEGLILFDRAGVKDKPLADVRVRQAINYALDRKGLLKAIESGLGSPTTQVYSPQSPGYEKSLDSKYNYDPQKAKSLLAEAGYSNGFTLVQPESPNLGSSIYTLIQQQLKEVGITVKYVNEGANLISAALAPKYGSMLMRLQANPDFWQGITNELLPTATWNPFKYTDAKVVQYASEYQNATSAEDGARVLKQLNEYIVDQAWFAPIYRPQATFITDAKTTAQTQVGNAYPYLWNIKPKN
jgi:peptide/nickel transport system substrate-binding protein